MLRIDPKLHALLRGVARDQGLSLNDYCARKLAAPAIDPESVPGFEAAVQRASAVLGKDLIGVVLFGSWARGEAADGSDVDLLIAAEQSVPLGRDLYRLWDEAPMTIGTRVLEPQFVHLPDPDQTVAGLWAEVALDGIVLFEKGLRLSRRLARIRGDIVAGKIVRRTAHGQPYWVRNEVA